MLTDVNMLTCFILIVYRVLEAFSLNATLIFTLIIIIIIIESEKRSTWDELSYRIETYFSDRRLSIPEDCGAPLKPAFHSYGRDAHRNARPKKQSSQ